MNGSRKPSDIPSATLPINRHVDVHVTGNDLIGVDSDEPLLVLRTSRTSHSDDDDNDDYDDDDDCAIEFEVVEPFQPKSAIQAFASVLGSSRTVRTPVWLLVDTSLLKSDRLSVDETSVLDSQITNGESLEVRGVNYTAIRLALTPGFHVVAAVAIGSDVTPQVDLFQYIYVPDAGPGHLSPCVAELLCGDTAGPTAPRDRMNPPIDDLSSDDPVSLGRDRSAARARVPARSGGAAHSTAQINPLSVRVEAGEHGRTNGEETTQTAGDKTNPNSSRVTDIDHQREGGDDADKTSRNRSSVAAPAAAGVPYVVHPMVHGAPPATSYVVKLGNTADDLAASGPQGPPVWRPSGHDHDSSSERVSPTVIAVLTSLGVAIFFVIVCILGFVVSELVCGESGYGRARLLGKHGARVSPYYVD